MCPKRQQESYKSRRVVWSAGDIGKAAQNIMRSYVAAYTIFAALFSFFEKAMVVGECFETHI